MKNEELKVVSGQCSVVSVLRKMVCASIIFIFHFLFSISLVGCSDDPVLDVNPNDLTGCWEDVNSPQEYWRFREGGTGVTWDESEDISEEESNMKFEWTLDRDELTFVFRGENENQAVPRVYRIREITSVSMKWENYFGETKRLKRRRDLEK